MSVEKTPKQLEIKLDLNELELDTFRTSDLSSTIEGLS